MNDKGQRWSSFLARRWVRVVIKMALVALAAGAAIVFFGICVPFSLLALELTHYRGLAGIVYVWAGALFGLVFGGASSAYSLARSPRLVTRYYLWLMGVLLMLSLLHLAWYSAMPELFAHI